MSQLTDIAAALESLSRHIDAKDSAVRDVARGLRAAASGLQAVAAGSDDARRAQAVADALTEAARACERAADALGDAGGEGMAYVRRNVSGGAGGQGATSTGASGVLGALGRVGLGGARDAEALEPSTTPGTGPYVLTPMDAKTDAAGINGDAPLVQQGQIGDCYFVAAAIALARTAPGKLANRIRRDDDGGYTVTLSRWGLLGTREHPVRVSPFPVLRGATVDGDPDWVSVLEKAWAQEKGGYAGAEGGWSGAAFHALTGTKAGFSSDTDVGRIGHLLGEGFAVTAASFDRSTPGQTVGNHEYVVTGVGGDGIHLQNPWGPDGGFSEHGYHPGTLVLTQEEFSEQFRQVTWWGPA